MTSVARRLGVREIARRYLHEPEFRRGFNQGFRQGVRSPKARAGFRRNLQSTAIASAFGSAAGMRYVQYLRAHSHQSIGTLGELRIALLGSVVAVTVWRAAEFVHARVRKSYAA